VFVELRSERFETPPGTLGAVGKGGRQPSCCFLASDHVSIRESKAIYTKRTVAMSYIPEQQLVQET
jgi:hypothetical protein